MSLFSALSVGASGMAAQRARAEVLVENLANAETTRTPEGGLWHWLESVTPEEIWAQAFSVAVRRARSRVLAEAVRQAWRPWKVMQTSQRIRPVFRVE